MVSCTSGGEASPNIIEHFSGFISSPVPLAYVLRITLTAIAYCCSTLKNKSVSSANNRCEIPRARRQIRKGVISSCVTFSFKSKNNPSATNKNKNGERGSP